MKNTKTPKKVLVVGQGYVGLPLSIELVKANYYVTGFDTNDDLVSNLLMNNNPISGLKDQDLSFALNSRRFKITSKIEELDNFDVAIICVPTPLDENRRPDLRSLLEACRTVAIKLEKGNLVIVESTVAPGTTRKLVSSILVSDSEITQDNFMLAYSPERIDPLNSEWHLTNTPKIIAGIDIRSLLAVKKFYGKFILNLVEANSLEAAESAKLLENSFRLVNIAFINEFWQFCYNSGLEIQEIISLARTKPYGFMDFYPSLGAGGHCIPVDPIYLLDGAREVGVELHSLNLASVINAQTPLNFLIKVKNLFPDLLNKKVLLIGVAYKKNISDTRDTPVKILKEELLRQGAIVFWHDPFVKNWEGSTSSKLNDNYDIAILCTPHDILDLSDLGSVPIFDPRFSS